MQATRLKLRMTCTQCVCGACGEVVSRMGRSEQKRSLNSTSNQRTMLWHANGLPPPSCGVIQPSQLLFPSQLCWEVSEPPCSCGLARAAKIFRGL